MTLDLCERKIGPVWQENNSVHLIMSWNTINSSE